MGTNKEQTPESNNKANYEAAVLDFLDKEMAAVQQPNKKQNESGQEVDALVSDLLKQVITESDQLNGESLALSDNLEAALSEDPPLEVLPKPEDPPLEVLPKEAKQEAPHTNEKFESPDKAASSAAKVKQDDGPAEPPLESPSSTLFNPRTPGLALGPAPRRKIPMIAAASVCLLIGIGAAVFYLWGSSGNSADTQAFQPDAAVPLALENTNMDAPATLQQLNIAEPESSSSAAKIADSPQITSQPDRKAPSSRPSDSVPATPIRKAAAPKAADPKAAPPQVATPKAADPKPKPVAPAATDQSTGTTSDTESELPTVEFLTAQISAPSPLTAASNLNIDKSALPPMPDGIALANSALEKNPELTSQSPAAGPAGSRNLVPSVLISQVSPAYPEVAIRSRTSGSVVLELQIDNEGKVVKATPVSGPSVFYSEAVKAAMQYRYRPATLDGKNVSSKSRVRMVFNLNR